MPRLSNVTTTAGGTIVFTMFGPSATAACAGTAVFTSTPVTVNGPGTYGPVTTTVTVAGTFWWVATYSGDTNNLGVASACGDEQSVVAPASPSIVTTPTATAQLPTGPVYDQAKLSGLPEPAAAARRDPRHGHVQPVRPSPTAACSGTACLHQHGEHRR